ncbi:UDP-N-acetylmuramoyl-L-alanyl-D-glutamate--2,6-diaminopimelate ligase [Hugenholtzia roseola]|uniref:UDP-N-acetylmuramoyl-L-alanyl-D-glutamate--2, 6-diaminopimelate ligase n=1 Tax=Hugenholtzia roseola TaxID=1002 RepID=UPI00047D742B
MKDTLRLLAALSNKKIQGTLPDTIANLGFDSRQVQLGDAYIALRGTQTDGHQFIPQAIAAGASLIVCEQVPPIDSLQVPQNQEIAFVLVPDTAAALAHLAAAYYDFPSQKLQLVGVTGTNGKTTTVTLLYQLFQALGYNVGLLSTIENRIKDQILTATHTTPNPLEINRLLAQMVEARCAFAFMEVSSHAVVQKRIEGLHFAGAVFTNISHDHLDYHKTFEAYIKAKKGFFDGLSDTAFALVNQDDKRGSVMLQNCQANHYTFGLKSLADFRAKIVDNLISGLVLEIEETTIYTQLVGAFNAYNLLAVYSVALLLGEEKGEVLRALSALRGVKGRFQSLTGASGKYAVVDYAHTPDALENVLDTLLKVRTPIQKIITVVGCGGNRDAAKRPIMARMAVEKSDFVFLTSDNPRFEDPESILDQMEAGIKGELIQKTNYQRLTDRAQAIAAALARAQKGDIVLIAGKGHENYQEVAGSRQDFDDAQQALKWL